VIFRLREGGSEKFFMAFRLEEDMSMESLGECKLCAFSVCECEILDKSTMPA
jgi:hypothetical protein